MEKQQNQHKKATPKNWIKLENLEQSQHIKFIKMI